MGYGGALQSNVLDDEISIARVTHFIEYRFV